MVDTSWGDFTDATHLDPADVGLLMRGAGGLNFPFSLLAYKASDGRHKMGAGADITGTLTTTGSPSFGMRSTLTGGATVVMAGAYGSEGSTGVRIQSSASSPAVALQMGADTTNNIGFVQAMQPLVSWVNRPLVLQGNGGNVAIGQITAPERLSVNGHTTIGGSLFLTGNQSFAGPLSATAKVYHSNTLGAVVGGEGSTSDLFLANKAGSAVMSVPTGTLNANFGGNITAAGGIKPASYTVGTLPSASALGAGTIIYVSNEAGGATTAFSDATNWRRHADRNVVS